MTLTLWFAVDLIKPSLIPHVHGGHGKCFQMTSARGSTGPRHGLPQAASTCPDLSDFTKGCKVFLWWHSSISLCQKLRKEGFASSHAENMNKEKTRHLVYREGKGQAACEVGHRAGASWGLIMGFIKGSMRYSHTFSWCGMSFKPFPQKFSSPGRSWKKALLK